MKKRTIPKWLWVTGTITLFVVGGLGYKKLVSTRPTPRLPSDSLSATPQTESPPATVYRPDENSGMLASGMPPHAHAASPSTDPEAQPSNASMDSATPASMQKEAEEMQASEVSTPLASDNAIASMQSTLDAKGREIAQLKKALADARRSATRSRLTAQKTRTRAMQRARRNRTEVLLGFHIKQIIPGQGWVEDEATGKQTIVTVGERISGAEVTKIDAERYEIQTTAGVIQF